MLLLATCSGPLGNGNGGLAGSIAVVSPATFGAGDQDIVAANLVQYDFADTNRIYGKPAAAARAAAALDYVAGAVANGPRWAALPEDIGQSMLAARVALRNALGILPNASSQDVVDALLAAAAAIDSGDAAAIHAALSNSVFTLLPAQTLDRLGDIAYMQPVNLAADKADNAMTQIPEPGCASCSEFSAP